MKQEGKVGADLGREEEMEAVSAAPVSSCILWRRGDQAAPLVFDQPHGDGQIAFKACKARE